LVVPSRNPEPSPRNLGDFELSWKEDRAKGNSGLKYRIRDRYVDERRVSSQVRKPRQRRGSQAPIHAQEATQEYIVGFEYQMIDNEGHADARGLLSDRCLIR
jgi:hypothetical protein